MGMTDGIHLDMEDVPLKNRGDVVRITDDALSALDEEDKVKGIMHNPNDGRYPISRDWFYENLNIKCCRGTCIANFERNHQGRCGVPSRIEIDRKGKCKGYQSPEVE